MKTNQYDEITFVAEVYGKDGMLFYEDSIGIVLDSNVFGVLLRNIGEEIETFVKGLHCERRGVVDHYGQVMITVERRFSPSDYVYAEKRIPPYAVPVYVGEPLVEEDDA